jgi:hypothetical protein
MRLCILSVVPCCLCVPAARSSRHERGAGADWEWGWIRGAGVGRCVGVGVGVGVVGVWCGVVWCGVVWCGGMLLSMDMHWNSGRWPRPLGQCHLAMGGTANRAN